MRDRLTPGRLAMLGRLQPEHGGFLDAAPLTGFVAIALCGAGETAHPVACRAGAFLRQSVREDGSWPIDTHLKTWVTTQSVEALSELRESDVAHATPAGPTEMSPLKSVLGVESAVGIRDWLLRAQYARTHPYTGSPPGGWAWTDLPGGVPDADDTAGALIALRRLTDHADPEAPVVCAAAERGLRWLLDLQNSDGGMPTFCRGWGTLPFDRSCSDLTAHALIAIALWSDACSDHASRPGERGGGRFGARSPLVFSTLMKDCSPPRAAALSRRLNKAVRRAIRYLARVRNGDGSWSPLWFGNEAAPHAENRVYGTARSVAALQALRDAGVRSRLAETLLEGGARWLLAHRNDDGGWGAERGVASSVEETALALHALTKSGWAPARIQKEGVAWIENSGVLDGSVRPAPIGLYFARLWYGEALYSTIFALAACGAVAARTRHSINRFSPDLRPDSASTRSPSPENPLNSSIT